MQKIKLIDPVALKYSWYKNPEIWLAESSFDRTLLKTSKPSFMPKIKFIHRFLDIADLRILQSHWLRTFWLIPQEPEFSQIWDLCRHKANNMNFHLTPNSEKAMIKFLEITLVFGHFGPSLPILGQKWLFSKNQVLPVSRFLEFTIIYHYTKK